MKFSPKSKTIPWLPKLKAQVWILIAGRLLSSLGTGFTLFYAPIFFADQVGISKTAVGLALGSGQISGVIGRILSGSMADSAMWGRRRTLLLATLVSAIASFVLAATNNFATLVVGNLLMGLGVGLYWPATETVVADLTTPQERHEAYALTRLGDSLGLGFGIVIGGAIVALTGAYRPLFIIDAFSFLVFFGIVYGAIAETYQPPQTEDQTQPVKAIASHNLWAIALSDRALVIYVAVNLLFTTYIAQIHSTIPLYFTNFISLPANQKGFAISTISALFTWHLAVSIVLQLPMSKWLRRFSHPYALSFSAVIWAVGFVLIWMTGVSPDHHLGWAILATGVLAIATISYNPSASALVANLAPDSLRGVYLSINSLCWAGGYFIGPSLGGWALDQPRPWADSLWLFLALSVGIAIAILQYLQRILQATQHPRT